MVAGVRDHETDSFGCTVRDGSFLWERDSVTKWLNSLHFIFLLLILFFECEAADNLNCTGLQVLLNCAPSCCENFHLCN